MERAAPGFKSFAPMTSKKEIPGSEILCGMTSHGKSPSNPSFVGLQKQTNLYKFPT
jgi:hypothetical protein